MDNSLTSLANHFSSGISITNAGNAGSRQDFAWKVDAPEFVPRSSGTALAGTNFTTTTTSYNGNVIPFDAVNFIFISYC